MQTILKIVTKSDHEEEKNKNRDSESEKEKQKEYHDSSFTFDLCLILCETPPFLPQFAM